MRYGEEQSVKPAGSSLSSWHSKLNSSAGVRLSLPLKLKVASVRGVSSGGPDRIVVSGGVPAPSWIVHA
jgi:hypothetical protein